MAIKSVLITGYSAEIAPWCEELKTNKKEYAAFHNMEFICGYGDPQFPHPSYQRINLIREALVNGFEYIVWADMDVVFINFVRNIIDELKPKMDWGGYGETERDICAGLMVFRNTPYVREFWDSVVAAISSAPKTDLCLFPWEQKYINEVNKRADYQKCQFFTVDEVGGFSEEGWHDNGERTWQRGDITVHLSAFPWQARRDAYMKRYLWEINKSRIGRGAD